jgi:hypothetical protein
VPEAAARPIVSRPKRAETLETEKLKIRPPAASRFGSEKCRLDLADRKERLVGGLSIFED